MVQGQESPLQARLSALNLDTAFLLLGLYGWEYFQSLDVEYAVIRGRLSFRWPLIPYLVGRLCIFIVVLLRAIRMNLLPSGGFICLPSVISLATLGNIGLASSSANFMIRTWVIWKDSRLVHIMLLLFALGHWIVLTLDVVTLQASKLNGQCAIRVVHPRVNAAIFVYTLFYDFVVLVLSIVGLSKRPSKSPLRKQLRSQGLIYFVVAVIIYIPPTVFALLGVNSMVSLTGFLAITLSTIVSSKAVRSLLGLRPPGSSQITEESVENDVALTTQIPIQMAMSTVEG